MSSWDPCEYPPFGPEAIAPEPMSEAERYALAKALDDEEEVALRGHQAYLIGLGKEVAQRKGWELRTGHATESTAAASYQSPDGAPYRYVLVRKGTPAIACITEFTMTVTVALEGGASYNGDGIIEAHAELEDDLWLELGEHEEYSRRESLANNYE